MKRAVGFVSSDFRDVVVDSEDTFAARYEENRDMAVVESIREMINQTLSTLANHDVRKVLENHMDLRTQT